MTLNKHELERANKKYPNNKHKEFDRVEKELKEYDEENND